MDETRAGGTRRHGHRACAGDVDGRVLGVPDRRHDTGEVDHSVGTAERFGEGRWLEAGWNHDHLRMQGMVAAPVGPRSVVSGLSVSHGRPQNGPHLEAAGGEVSGQMTANESGCAGHRHAALQRHPPNAFW
jgi:hypothetical protein